MQQVMNCTEQETCKKENEKQKKTSQTYQEKDGGTGKQRIKQLGTMLRL